MKTWMYLTIGLCALTATPVSAQHIDGKLKLALDTDVLGLAGSNSTTAFGVGVGSPSLVGLAPGVPPFGLDVAYGLNDNMVLGAQARLGIASVSSNAVYAIGVLPHFDFVVLPHSSFRPYFGALAGIVTQNDGRFGGNGDTYANFGAQVGGYGFVSKGFSIGPRLVFMFSQGMINTPTSNRVFSLQLQLEIAGWM